MYEAKTFINSNDKNNIINIQVIKKEMIFIYLFIFNLDEEIAVLPINPASFQTNVKGNTKSIDLISVGESTIIKDIPLREFSFTICLSRDKELSEIKDTEYYHDPLYYLNLFREFRASKKPIRFILTRVLPDGTTSFSGNLLVSIEDYEVDEKAGEEGDYWIDFKLKEYRNIEVKITEKAPEPEEDGILKVVQTISRPAKEPAKTYTVKDGDTLWGIAKLQLNDGSKHSEIAKLNNIDNPNNLKVGQVLKLQ